MATNVFQRGRFGKRAGHLVIRCTLGVYCGVSLCDLRVEHSEVLFDTLVQDEGRLILCFFQVLFQLVREFLFLAQGANNRVYVVKLDACHVHSDLGIFFVGGTE